jgi:hypothetical protein
MGFEADMLLAIMPSTVIAHIFSFDAGIRATGIT